MEKKIYTLKDCSTGEIVEARLFSKDEYDQAHEKTIHYTDGNYAWEEMEAYTAAYEIERMTNLLKKIRRISHSNYVTLEVAKAGHEEIYKIANEGIQS